MNYFCENNFKMVIRIILAVLLFVSLFSSKIYSQKSCYLIEDNEKYTYEMISSDLDSLVKLFPERTHLFSIGNSEFGLPIKVVRIGSKTPKKRSMLFVGNVHAREDYSSKFVMKFLNMYLLSFTGDSIIYKKATDYLADLDLYFMPVANPDGLKIAHEDWVNIEKFLPEINQIKKIETFGEWKANGKGIDLNDSFDDGTHALNKSYNSSPVPCSEGFKGKYAAEPIETQVIQKFVSEIRPLMTLSFHTKGDLIYWADSKTHSYFNGIDSLINDAALNVSNFSRVPVSPDPSTYGGGLENYVRYQFGLLGSCVELSSGDSERKQFPDSEFNKRVWKKAWKIPTTCIELVIKYANKIEEISLKYKRE
jgi:g-D-glutamyl-meso-diaminopimelate peptidase